jgi:tetratricopeptide (TPR) repeat protein
MRKKMKKTGRNEPCPCGSGKKYKHCCLEKDREKETAPKPLDKKGMHYLKQAMEKELSKIHGNEFSQAEELVYDGWEALACDPREAKKCFERAIKLEPDLADAYNGLAEIAILRGNANANLCESLSHSPHAGERAGGAADLAFQ